jgi:transcriptional regulator
MYLPAKFSETDLPFLVQFIRQHPLGLLISAGTAGLEVSPLPFLYRDIDGKARLIAHLAKANDHWRSLSNANECLVVFQGAENYVSPSWYPSKQSTHKVVPTWNYELVQVKGKPSVIESTDWLRTQVGEMTDSMEQQRQHPWQVNDAPADYIAGQLQAIVGLDIEITEIVGKWKMSQNRSAEDAHGVALGMADVADPHANPLVSQIVASRATDQ